MSDSLHSKLNPNRYPNMSPTMGAIMGFILEREYTTPVMADVIVTTDGSMIGWPSDAAGGLGHSLHILAIGKVCDNLFIHRNPS
jgi:hypothetical protein